MCHGQIIGDAIHRARKDFPCMGCGKIKKGERYRRVYLEFEGETSVQRTCAKCTAKAILASREGPDGCFYWDQLDQNVAEIVESESNEPRCPEGLGGGRFDPVRVEGDRRYYAMVDPRPCKLCGLSRKEHVPLGKGQAGRRVRAWMHEIIDKVKAGVTP